MIEFADSARSSLGVEWELALVDAQSFELTGRADEVLERTASVPELDGKIVGEMLTNTVEVVSGVHNSVHSAIEEVHDAYEQLRGLVDPLGIKLMSTGTHPFSRWADQSITEKERYAELVERTQWWGRHMLIYGVHVHVGIDSRDKVLPIVNTLMNYIPQLMAVSASSPYWQGEDTKYASNRAMLFQQLPTAGLPYQFGVWEEYEKYVADMLHTGVIDEINEIRWDIRPSPKLGTIEIRACDGMPRLREIAAVTAYLQCLVDDMSERLDHGETLPTMPDWFHVENKWRAARYGMDAIIIENDAADERLVGEVVADEVARLMPTAVRLGCTNELEDMLSFARTGASYQRQRAAFEETGRMDAVVAEIIAESESGLA